MSLLLDDKLVGEVAEYCPGEFLNYYECLGKGDAQNCFEEQKVLSACVQSKAPAFKKITKECATQMSAYENCVRVNSDFRTQCFDILTEMRDCVARTVGPRAE